MQNHPVVPVGTTVTGLRFLSTGYAPGQRRWTATGGAATHNFQKIRGESARALSKGWSSCAMVALWHHVWTSGAPTSPVQEQ
eukprot:2651995-Pleurochrysis_carterae.AAC.1